MKKDYSKIEDMFRALIKITIDNPIVLSADKTFEVQADGINIVKHTLLHFLFNIGGARIATIAMQTLMWKVMKEMDIYYQHMILAELPGTRSIAFNRDLDTLRSFVDVVGRMLDDRTGMTVLISETDYDVLEDALNIIGKELIGDLDYSMEEDVL